MKKIRRVTSLVVAAAFLFNESAMAFVNVAEPHKDKLSPKTIFTSSDKTDQFVRVAAKYIETQLGSAISKMPLAGVERSLSDIREIASSLSIDGRTFRVSGGSGEGQVIIELSDSHIIRYFNPQMTGLSLGRTDISVLGEYDVNKYLRFQFIRFSKDIPFGEREPSSGSPDIFLQVKGRAPEGSLLEAYKVLVEDFSKKVFTRQEFRLKRVKSSGRVFSATTVNTELDAFVYLGILVPDTSKKPFTYVIADRYGRASSRVVEGVKTVLSGAAFASPSKDDLNRLLPHLEDALNGEVDAIVPEDLVFRASYLFDPLTDEDVRALFARAEEDISILDIKLRSGYTLAVPAREIFINAFDSIKEKAEAKVEGGKLYGEISITVEKVMDG
ncbi:MAG: hypothetical protein PHW14_03145, partial [Candidatus Omnitrophica bacterium]|nr:hypothetical protein [Candidatus Omnitrophota bacterium]